MLLALLVFLICRSPNFPHTSRFAEFAYNAAEAGSAANEGSHDAPSPEYSSFQHQTTPQYTHGVYLGVRGFFHAPFLACADPSSKIFYEHGMLT